jgi:hypothetical protein
LEHFVNILEKLATKNKISDTPGNILNIDESGIKVSKKHDSAITENGSKNFHVLTLGENSENIAVTACCNAAGQLLPPVLIFKEMRTPVTTEKL